MKNPFVKSVAGCLALVAVAVGLLSGRAEGAAYYWDTDGSTAGFGDTAGTWGSSAFWSTDNTGASGTSNTTITTSDGINFGTDTLALGSTAAAVGVSGAVTVNSITFGSAQTNPVTLSGGTSITLGGTTPAITVNNASNTISSVLAGSSFTKAGNGTLTLTNANTHTGTTTISAGTLRLLGANMWKTARTYTINGGAVLLLDGNVDCGTGTAAATTINGTGTLRMNGWYGKSSGTGVTITMSLGAGGLIDIQTGATLQNGGWQYITWSGNSGGLNVDGTLQFADGNSVTVGALTGSGSITKGWGSETKTLTVGTANGSGTFSGTIANPSGVIALTKTGTGTQTLSGNNSYSGTTVISGGILAIAHNNALGNTTGNTTVTATGSNNGPQLRLSGNITSPENISINGNTEQNNWSCVIDNTSGTNTLSGTITLNNPAGNIRIGSGGGELIFGGTITQATSSRNLILRAATGAALTVNNAIANNNGPLNVINSGAVTLKGASTAIGATTVGEGGLLKLGVTDALKTSADLTIGFPWNFWGSDQGTFDLAGFNQTVNALIGTKNTSNVGADSTRIVTNSATFGISALTVGNGNGSGTFNGVIMDGATAKVALTKVGTGTQTLAGESTYSGTTIISNGTLSLTHLNAMQYSPLDTANSVTGDGTKGLKTNQSNLKLGGLSGNKNLAAVFTTTSGGYGSVSTLTLNTVTGADLSYSGIIANGAAGMALVKTGAGSQTLSGTNTYTGDTTIYAGTLALGASGTLDTDNNLVLAGGTLSAGDFTNSLGTLNHTASSTIALGSGTLSFANSSALAGTWSGTLDLTGTIGATTLRFGTDDSGLTEAQLDSITCLGQPISLIINAQGYVLRQALGTVYRFR